MTAQEVIDAFLAGGEARTRARMFLTGGSRAAYEMMTNPEFVQACIDNAEAMGIAAPEYEDDEDDEDDEDEEETHCQCCGQPIMREA